MTLAATMASRSRSEFATVEAERQSIAAQRNHQYQRERLKDAQIRSPFNGLVVRRGEALGIPTPANRVLWALVKLIEGKAA